METNGANASDMFAAVAIRQNAIVYGMLSHLSG